MTKTKLVVLALCTLAAPAFALSDALAAHDANGDGALSLEEAQAAWTDLTAEAFASADANADGNLDDAEIEAATAAGVLAAM
jgi:hypothetical protein